MEKDFELGDLIDRLSCLGGRFIDQAEVEGFVEKFGVQVAEWQSLVDLHPGYRGEDRQGLSTESLLGLIAKKYELKTEDLTVAEICRVIWERV